MKTAQIRILASVRLRFKFVIFVVKGFLSSRKSLIFTIFADIFNVLLARMSQNNLYSVRQCYGAACPCVDFAGATATISSAKHDFPAHR